MTRIASSRFLQAVLLADGALVLGVAATHFLGGDGLASFLGLPAAGLTGIGVLLAPWGLWLIALARAAQLPVGVVWAVIGLNLLWAAGALALAVGATLSPSAWGLAYLWVHVVGVAGFADLEWRGLRQSRRVSVAGLAGA